MSIASQIIRLQNSKSSIKTSITNKGVTVPSSATLDSYSSYIDLISGGLDYVETTTTSLTTPVWNTCYQWTNNPTTLSIGTPAVPSDGTKEIVLRFTTGASTPSIAFPTTFLWSSNIDSYEANTTYEISLGYDNYVGKVTAVGVKFQS